MSQPQLKVVPDSSAAEAFPPAIWRSRIDRVIVGLTLLTSCALLFARLGHYPLWYDEAGTALPALNVFETGDMSAYYRHNLVAYGDGLELRDLKFRYMPPLQYYFDAPFIGLWNDPAGARFPFALCGLGCVALMVSAAWRARLPTAGLIVVGIAIVGNISLILYCRQCRYYGLVLFLFIALMYAYIFWDGRTRSLIGVSFLAAALLATNYQNYAQACAILAADYLFLRPRISPRLSWRQTAWFLGIQALAAIPLALLFHPWTRTPAALGHDWIAEKLHLLWLIVRDANHNEFFPGLVVAAAIAVAILLHDRWLGRAIVAMLVCIVAGAMVYPRQSSPVAEVRYFLPLIPLGIAVTVLVVSRVARRSVLAAVIIALLACGTNVLCGDFIMDQPLDRVETGASPRFGFRSLIADYAQELQDPQDDPYTPVIAWIHQNVLPGERVLVTPSYMLYPLIYHAPEPLYCWQLNMPLDPALQKADPAHFAGRLMPRYVVQFGTEMDEYLADGLRNLHPPPHAHRVAAFPVYWRVMYRPETAYRNFERSSALVDGESGIVIYRLE